jgi:F0F1-type ATP synthase membrane subunit b/b'
MSDYMDKVVGGLVALVVAGISWLIRRVVTNGKEIDLLKAEIAEREKRREEDRAYLREIKESFEKARQEDRVITDNLGQDIREIRQDIKDIFKSNIV